MEQLWEPNHPVNVYLRLPTVKYIQHGAYKIFCCGENMSRKYFMKKFKDLFMGRAGGFLRENTLNAIQPNR